MAGSGEKLLASAEQEAVVEIASPANVLSTQVEKAGPSGTVASTITEAISESVQIPSGEPQNIALPLGMTLELPALGSVDTPALIALPIFSVLVPQLAAKAVDEDIVLGPVISPHARVVEVLLKQFLDYIKTVVPLLLQDPDDSEGIIARQVGLAGSIRCFDAQLADLMKLVIDRL